MVTVVVLNYNDYNTTNKYVNYIKDYKTIERIIIVDNCSTDDSFENLKALQSTKIDIIRSEKNGGYGYGNNFGIKYTHEKYSSKYILISNPDVLYDEKVLISMEEKLRNDDSIGIIAPTMKNPDNTVSHISSWTVDSGWKNIFGTFSPFAHFVKNYYHDNNCKSECSQVGAVAGSMLLINYDILNKIDFYDEEMFLFWEETVLGVKLKNAGYKTVILNNEYFTHYHSVSIKKSIKSQQARTNLLWKSLSFVLAKYYNFNKFKLLIVKFLHLISDFYILIRNPKK